MPYSISLNDSIEASEVLELYQALNWSAATKPKALLAALRNSHSLVTARFETRLVGLGNAISDGYLVVYYPHLLVHPDFQGKGIGRRMVEALQQRYAGFHQQQVVADGAAVDFYAKLGFSRAGRTVPMWIYDGADH